VRSDCQLRAPKGAVEAESVSKFGGPLTEQAVWAQLANRFGPERAAWMPLTTWPCAASCRAASKASCEQSGDHVGFNASKWPGAAGSYRCVIHLVPHYELDDMAVKVRLTTEINSGRTR